MNEVETMMKQMQQGNIMDMRVHNTLDQSFVLQAASRPPRFGHHLSEFTAPFSGKGQLCFRQHVLARFHEPAPEPLLPIKTLRVYLEGWYIHLKWQQLFKLAGYAVEIENTRKDPIWKLYHTPDIVAKFTQLTGEELWIVEIKSMSRKSYESVMDKTDPYKIHPGGYKQAQLYMYLLGVKRAMLLLDNKDSSEHREICFDYDPEFVKDYVHRFNVFSQLCDSYEKNEGIPPRVCDHKDCSRARGCSMRNVCWIGRNQRERYLLKDQHPDEQKNASIVHEVE